MFCCEEAVRSFDFCAAMIYRRILNSGLKDGSMSTDEKIIAFVIYPGLTSLDFIGPLSALGHLGAPYKAVVVAETTGSFLVESGLVYFGATKTFDEVPHPFGIVVPGGGMPTIRAMANPAIQKYLRENAETAEFVASVCTGALILAAADLLHGRNATTHWGYYHELERLGATYVKKRWVEDGKFITAAGVSAGIDMGLYLAAKLKDEATAKRIQRGIEYDPEPPFGGIDWTDAEQEIIPPERADEATKTALREALALKPELYDRLMATTN
jgi:transcriptional regulator GlxA family with amidase domain